MNWKYILGAAISLPMLPLLYVQGKRIWKSVPRLPEAKGDEGIVQQENHQRLQIVAIGESTIAGVGAATHEEAFTGTFAQELARTLNANVAWKVYARSGYTAEKVRTRILPRLTTPQADLILVGLGGNNAFKLQRPSQWRKEVAALIEALREKYKQTPIVFLNMPPIKLFPAFTPAIRFTVGNLVELFGAELAQLVQDYEQVYYNDVIITLDKLSDYTDLKLEPAQLFSDGVHPAVLTYQLWAKHILDFVMEQRIFDGQLTSYQKQ